MTLPEELVVELVLPEELVDDEPEPPDEPLDDEALEVLMLSRSPAAEHENKRPNKATSAPRRTNPVLMTKAPPGAESTPEPARVGFESDDGWMGGRLVHREARVIRSAPDAESQ